MESALRKNSQSKELTTAIIMTEPFWMETSSQKEIYEFLGNFFGGLC